MKVLFAMNDQPSAQGEGHGFGAISSTRFSGRDRRGSRDSRRSRRRPARMLPRAGAGPGPTPPHPDHGGNSRLGGPNLRPRMVTRSGIGRGRLEVAPFWTMRTGTAAYRVGSREGARPFRRAECGTGEIFARVSTRSSPAFPRRSLTQVDSLRGPTALATAMLSVPTTASTPARAADRPTRSGPRPRARRRDGDARGPANRKRKKCGETRPPINMCTLLTGS